MKCYSCVVYLPLSVYQHHRRRKCTIAGGGAQSILFTVYSPANQQCISVFTTIMQCIVGLVYIYCSHFWRCRMGDI